MKWKSYLQKKISKNIVWILLILVFVFFVFIRPLVSRFWGVKEIGSFFEASKPYEAKYYVYLFLNGDNLKNYKTPSDVIVDEECIEFGNGDNREVECEGFVKLEKAYFSNGRNILFNGCRIESGNTDCDDKNGNNWKIEFRGEKVK